MNSKNCEHCNANFKTKSALNNHKNKAKYCLIIQGKIEPAEDKEENKCSLCEKSFSTKQNLEVHKKKCEGRKKDEFKCDYCNNILSSKQSLINHLNCCYQKKDKEFSELKELTDKEFNQLKERTDKDFTELKERTDKELIEKDKNIIKANTQIENYKEQISNYKEQLRDLQDKLDKIANKAIDRPTTVVSNTTTNNNLNIVSSLDFNNLETIKNAIENRLNVNHVVDGQKGLAKFVVDSILKDEEGNLLYKCTDSSRNIFKYKNSNGEINKDVEAKKLISFMVDAGIKIRSVEIATEWCKDGNINGTSDITKYEIMVGPQESIMEIEDNSSSFKRQLVSMTSVN